MFNVIHEKSGFKVDFIIRKDQPYREIEFQRRRLIDLDGTNVWVVSSEDLIISKLYWAKDSFSQLQIGDIRKLMTSVKNLDMDYINKWIQKLGLSAIFAKVETL